MKKLKRSARLVEMTQYLTLNPHTLIPLTTFVERYGAAKSSISEDLAIIKEVCEGEETGELLTLAGAAGGVKYIPKYPSHKALPLIEQIGEQLKQPDRMLPGGYYYITDLLGQPGLMNDIGRMFASAFADSDIDCVMTVETKGIPIAYATAAHLNLPVVLVRRDHVVTEGSAVSINYVSGSHKSIHTMTLARRALKERSRVLLVDDFMRAGGTFKGMMDLLHEFDATVAGVGVLVESEDVSNEERLVQDYVSLIRVETVDARSKQMSVKPGNYFDHM
ncbi:pur operon repressor [Paenibacillus aquistagni]|uniref:Purine operon repressor, PurR n=1 Tax=Paenibacillus aquistagni TaxID=1852522 RepID=A0A1X7LZG6_9BACL|nr:pur operon repressor [Paenibacillus aquistagni]NMM55260.1 pur operon repressor [Paenibacillus aquistagni]SMG58924.1 purine operon repressor, PurR [Paenibacillus aquistagni]